MGMSSVHRGGEGPQVEVSEARYGIVVTAPAARRSPKTPPESMAFAVIDFITGTTSRESEAVRSFSPRSQKASGAHGDVHTSKGLNLAIDISTIRSTPTIPGPPVGPIAVCPQTKSARTIDGTNTWAQCNRKYGALPADDRTRCIAHS